MHRIFVRMGDFGAPSPKPTVLYSNSEWVGQLTTFRAVAPARRAALVRRYIDQLGQLRVVGTKWLKGSQCAPLIFLTVRRGDCAIAVVFGQQCVDTAGVHSGVLGPTRDGLAAHWASWPVSLLAGRQSP